MSVSDIRQHAPDDTRRAEAVPQPKAGGREVVMQCDRCGAGIDQHQRYCVVCGAHLGHAYDPAARYLIESGGRTRASRRTAVAPVDAQHSGGLALAAVLALIPVAAAIGVIAGRSSNNQDAQLIQALTRRQEAATTSSAGGALSVARHTQRSRGVNPNRRRASHARKAISTTRYGGAGQIAGFKPTKAAEKQGASDTQQVQKSTGKSYVNTQNNLPSQVVVP